MSDKYVPIALFRLGRIVATPNALERLTHPEMFRALQRHQAGDWGDVDEEDRHANDQALVEGSRLFSVFHSATGVKFWVITETDRSVTTFLLPQDY